MWDGGQVLAGSLCVKAEGHKVSQRALNGCWCHSNPA